MLSVRMDTHSGFVIEIKPLPPYYLDVIEEVLIMPSYPARIITLASGDQIPWDYKPEEGIELEPGDDDYDLWAKWMAVDKARGDVSKARELAKRNFLLSNCVRVITGPVHVKNQDWVDKVEAAFPDYTMPEHPGKRLLIFLKTQVISSPEEMEIIIYNAVSREVTMQGIMSALQGFQHKVAEDGLAGGSEQSSG